MNALFCPKKGYLAIIVIENLYKTEELLKMQFYMFVFVRIANLIKKTVICYFQS